MRTHPVRIGIVGCGSVMQDGYMPIAQDLYAHGLADVRMACDTTPERAAIARQFGIPLFTTDYQDIVSASDINLVLVLTPPAFHFQIAAAALQAGKHVLVEKPMALSLSDAAALAETAARSPGLLLVAPHIVLSPTYQRIGKHIHAGDIGNVFAARGLCGHGGPDWGAWYYQAGGGGPLFDLAVYNVTSLTGWLGPVRRVTAFVGTAIPERIIDGTPVSVESEDNTQLLLDFGNATFASITSSFTIQQYRDATLELYGSRGTIRLQGDDWAPKGYDLWQADEPAWQHIAETAPEWSYLDGLRYVVACIQAGTRPIITPEHAYHVLEILLKAREASHTGQAQRIESIFPPLRFV
jgi:predicted dehydrogenase